MERRGARAAAVVVVVGGGAGLAGGRLLVCHVARTGAAGATLCSTTAVNQLLLL